MKRSISIRFRSLVATGAAFLSLSASAGTYHWVGPEWGLYSEPANWRVGSAEGDVATACPSANDSVVIPTGSSVDLNGGSWTSKWSPAGVRVAFRNGRWKSLAGGSFAKGNTIALGEGADIELYNANKGVWWGHQTDTTTFNVEKGANLSLTGNQKFDQFTVNVKEGGVFTHNCKVGMCCGRGDRAYRIFVEQGGLARFPNGLEVDSDFYGGGYPWIKLAEGATAEFGGDVTSFKTDYSPRVEVQSGAVLHFTAPCAFTDLRRVEGNATSKVADGATITVRVDEGVIEDLNALPFGSGVTVRKTGAGSIVATTNAALVIAEGALAVSESYPSAADITFEDATSVALMTTGSSIVWPESLKMAADAQVSLRIAVAGVTIDRLPSAFSDVVVDEAKIGRDVPFLTCPDAASLEALREKILAHLPPTRNVYIQGQSLVLSEMKEQTFTGGADGTITDWNDPAGWRNGVVPTSGEVAVLGGGVVLMLAKTPAVGKIEVARGARVRVAGDAIELPDVSLLGDASLEITAGSAILKGGFSCAASVSGESVTLPSLAIAAGATLAAPDAMKFKNVALTVNGTLAVDGTSLYLGYAAAGETSYFELTADGGKIQPVADPATTGFAYYYLVPETGGRVKVPSGAIHLSNMPKESFAQGATTFVCLGAANANRQNAKDEAIEFVLDKSTLFTRNAYNGSNVYLACLGGGVTLRLKDGSAYRAWFADADAVGTNGRCGGFRLVGNARIVMEEGSRLVVPEDCTTHFDFSPDTEREVLTMTNAYLHLARTTGNGKAKIRMVGSENILEAAFPCWWSMNNGCNAFSGVKELNLDGAETKLTVVTWHQGVQGSTGRIFSSGANVTGEGSIVIGSTETDKGEFNHSWYHDLTILYGISGNACSGALRVGSDKTKIALLNGADWAGTLVSDGRIALGDPTATDAAVEATVGTLRMSAPFSLRVWRDAEGNLVHDRLNVTKGVVVATEGAGSLRLDIAEGVVLKAGEEIVLGTFPAGTFETLQVRGGGRSLKVVERTTETEGIVQGVLRLDSDVEYVYDPWFEKSSSDHGDHFTGEADISLNLEGGTRTITNWKRISAATGESLWSGQNLELVNGTLEIADTAEIAAGSVMLATNATLRLLRGCYLATAFNDGGTRVFDLAAGSRLLMDGNEWRMSRTRVNVAKGAEWTADLTKLTLASAVAESVEQKQWNVSGVAKLLRGINVVGTGVAGDKLTVNLNEGGELFLGGPVSVNGNNCTIDLVLRGGSLTLVWDAAIDAGTVRVADGAEVVVNVAKGVGFDESVIALGAGSKLTVNRDVAVDGLPQRYAFDLKYDRTGRSWWLSADSFREKVATISYVETKSESVVTNADMTVTTNAATVVEHVRPISFKVTYPNPDAESPNATETAQATDTIFRRRFPQGEGPWTITAEITDIYGATQVTELTIRKPKNPVAQPVPNGEILVGYAVYWREHTNQLKDIIENDFGNLIVPWSYSGRLVPEFLEDGLYYYWPSVLTNKWFNLMEQKRIYAMDMYTGNHSAALDRRIDEVWGDRYVGNNMGEYASFIYQGGANIGLDLNLAEARDRFVNRWMGNAGFGWQSKFVRSFSTCGAALAGYELAGGVDFICNEMWAIGAENIGYTSGEARAAARKWGPEYFCAWNAHEWQTTGIPYRTKQKYDSLLVGYLQEWIAGASAFSLESGANGTSDAYKYTDQYAADDPDKPANNRFYTGYTGHASSNYCATTKKFYDWTKANPRGNATPETKIALALGNCDGYLGLNRGYSVWSQGRNAETNSALWRYGAPENTQAMMQEFFYPHPAAFLAPYNNRFIGGTPYGQVDVAQIDDDSTLADLRRYKLLVFAGWNTMTPHVKDVLERYVEAGGTLVLSRPELTTRVDRDYVNYTDADLLPLFGELPPEGQPGDYVVYRKGLGTYYLLTARQFPSETADYTAAYKALVERLARTVHQTVRISGTADDPDSPQAIAYGVYDDKAYFLNADTIRSRTFTYRMEGETRTMTLEPCEIRAVPRTGRIEGFYIRIR